MTLPWSKPLAGQMDYREIDSPQLRGNPLGDPSVRPLWVYTPPGYNEGTERYPTVYVIQGWSGTVVMWNNRIPFNLTYPEKLDNLFASGEVPPCIVVFVDATTKYGGSQFVDSIGTGRYHSYLCNDVVPFVDRNYRTKASAAHRAIQGKSSGGFGALITPMLRPDLFGALASHAGDSLYDVTYIPAFAEGVRILRDHWNGDIEAWWADFSRPDRRAYPTNDDITLGALLGVAACFSPDANGKPVLPFDPVTGELRNAVWQKWLAWDPVRMIPRYAASLRRMKRIYIDAGRRDDFYLDLGATAMSKALVDNNVRNVQFELFDGTHFGSIEDRYLVSMRYLAKTLSGVSGPDVGLGT